MLQDILKSATKGNHDELEELMYVNQIMDKTLTLEQYKTLLATNYIVHAGIEAKLHDALDNELKFKLDIDHRNKLAALEKDLAEVQLQKKELDAMDFDFPNITDYNNAAAIGAMYVLEGATLGGNVIQKKLRANPAFQNLSLNYYTVYDGNLMPNWLTFVRVLNTSIPEADFSIATESAVKMFENIAEVARTVKAELTPH